jgi:hypothetical protein
VWFFCVCRVKISNCFARWYAILLDSRKVFANLPQDFDGEMAEWLKALVC